MKHLRLWLVTATVVSLATVHIASTSSKPVARPAGHPSVLTTEAPSPSPTPTPAIHHATRIVKATVLPLAPTATPTPSATPEQPVSVPTPYEANCYADCFPDLTPAAETQVLDAYKGSFDDPDGFKGLPNDATLRHYTCEYMHVIGYPAIPKDCAAALEVIPNS